jgi:hypothetical protein
MEVLDLWVWSLERPRAVPVLELPAHREAWVRVEPLGLGSIASQAPPMTAFAAERRAAATFGHYPSPDVLGPHTSPPTQRCQLAAARSWRRELLLLVYKKLSL